MFYRGDIIKKAVIIALIFCNLPLLSQSIQKYLDSSTYYLNAKRPDRVLYFNQLADSMANAAVIDDFQTFRMPAGVCMTDLATVTYEVSDLDAIAGLEGTVVVFINPKGKLDRLW